MICEVCSKNEASIHVTKIVNGNKEELNICPMCAEKIGGLNMFPDVNTISPLSFQNMISGLMDYVYSNTQKSDKVDLVCKNCGRSYIEFKEKGLLGCSNCYENFNETLEPLIKGIQGNSKHCGKIPKRAETKILRNRLILQLKEDLQRSIVMEKYEEAAIIRDKIRDIENNQQFEVE